MSHGNARLNVRGRLLLVERVLGDRRPVSHVAKELGISRQCAHRWVARFRAEGPAGLIDRSSRPHRCPTRTPAEVEARVLQLRRQRRVGPARLSVELGIPTRTVGAILRRHGVPRLAECDPLTGEVIRSSKQTAVRYERDHPGELVHMDVKKLGKIPDGGGWKVHGRQMGRTSAQKKAKIGYDFVHSLVDDHTRLAYCEVLPDELGTTCAAFFARAVTYFHAHGITQIDTLMTDNAWAYKWSLRQICADLGIHQIFIKVHCPWQNGKVERLNRTLQTEWAYRHAFMTNDERTAALAPWLEHYNTRRRHSALGGQPPISRLS